MTVQNPEGSQQPNQQEIQQATQEATQQATAQAQENAETMTAAQFRDWMDSLPDKIADAIDVKFGLRREAEKSAGNSGNTQQAQTQTEDPKSGGFLGSGKSFGDWWFGK